MKITDRLHLLRHDFVVSVAPGKHLPRFANTLVIFSDQIVLVDSGVAGSERKILEYVAGQGRPVCDIRTLILTHAHPDHIGSAWRLKQETGCSVIAHCAERAWIENIDLQFETRPVPGFYSLVDRCVGVDQVLHGDEVIAVDENLTLACLHTPGHSAGSISISIPQEGALFTADAIPVVDDIPTYDNYPDLRRSLERIGKLGGHELLLSSWAAPTAGAQGIADLIEQAGGYLDRIDAAVRRHYHGAIVGLDNCRAVVEELGLPPLFANPLTHRAFLSHGKTA